MSQTDVFRERVRQLIQLFKQKLANVPEVQSALILAEEQPADTCYIYSDYIKIASDIMGLDDAQLATIRRARNALNENNDAVSASHSDAKSLLEATKSVSIPQIVHRSLDQASGYYLPAVDELTKRLEGGHQMKLTGKQPVDGDPESDRVIWGHTKMDDPLSLLHFVICHYLERYVSEELKGRNISLGYEKDYFLNAMTDALILDHLTTNRYKYIFDLWYLPKAEGGIGWVDPTMLEAYQ